MINKNLIKQLYDFTNYELLIFLMSFKVIICLFVYLINIPYLITKNSIMNEYTRNNFTMFIVNESFLTFTYLFTSILFINYFNIKNFMIKILTFS